VGWKATGAWQGHYWFDPLHAFEGRPARVGFGMRLKQSWLLWTLSGEVWDDPPHGMPGRGTVEGRLISGGRFRRPAPTSTGSGSGREPRRSCVEWIN
jgi:hypothetical protein